MTLQEATNLIKIPATGPANPQTWADLGCGAGLFSRALLNLLPAESTIYAIDNRPQDISAPGIQFILADFEKDQLPLSTLDGIIMANSLHYVKNKLPLLRKLRSHLKPRGVLILVEYAERPSLYSKAVMYSAWCRSNEQD